MRITRASRNSLVRCAALAYLLVGTPAAAQVPERGPALNWVRLPGADACIAPVELANRVEQRLGRHVFVRANDAVVVIEGRIGPEPEGGYAVVLHVSDPDGTLYGTRELRTGSVNCHDLDEMAALVIAITLRHDAGGAGIELPAAIAAQLDALFADEPSQLDPSELPATRVQRQEVAPPRAAPPQAAPHPATFELGVDAGLLLLTGLQPQTSFAGDLRVSASLRRVGSVALSGVLGVSQTQTGAAQASGRLVAGFFAFGAQLCPPAWHVWLSDLSLCGELRVGRLGVTPSGFVLQHGTAHELWAELVPSASIRARLIDPAYLLLAAGAPIRLRRPEFRYIDDEGHSHTALAPALLGFQLELALGVAF